MTRTVRVDVFSMDDIASFAYGRDYEGTLQDFIGELGARLEDVPPEFRASVQVKLGQQDYGTDLEFEAWYQRPETPDEEAARIANEQQALQDEAQRLRAAADRAAEWAERAAVMARAARRAEPEILPHDDGLTVHSWVDIGRIASAVNVTPAAEQRANETSEKLNSSTHLELNGLTEGDQEPSGKS